MAQQNNKHMNALYESFKHKSDEELVAIINDNSYEQYAKDIAKQVLNGDRSEYLNMKEKEEQNYQNRINSAKKVKKEGPATVDEAIFQISKDVRFIRNIFAAALLVSAVGAIISLIIYIISLT